MNRIKTRLQIFSCLLLSIFLSFNLLPISILAEDSKEKVVRVGWYADSYNITGENGERRGYGYEYQQSVAAYTGWTYEYVESGWSDLLQMVQTGEIDLMSGVSYTEERAETMLFSELPMGEEKYFLYADLANTDILASNLSTLNGKSICLLEGSIQATQFYEWEKKHNLHLTYVYVNGFEDAKEKIASHEVDCVISTETPLWVELGMSALAMTGASDIYFAINQERLDLKEDLDNAMRKIQYERPFYADELYQRYLSTKSFEILSKEEQDWLKQHGAIRIGFLNNDAGVSVFDMKTGEMTGVMNDYIKYAVDCLGNQRLEFNLIGFDTREEQLQALQEDEIDMIFHVSQNPYAAEQNGYSLSNTVWTFNLAALTSKGYFDENAENSIAITKDNFALKRYVSYNYPQWKVVEYNSMEDVLKAVRNEQVDCFITGSSQVVKYMEDNKLRCVFLTQPGNASFAVRKGNTVLLSILNKTLKTMPSSMLSGALAMYDSTAGKVTIADFIKDNLFVVIMLFIGVFLVILLLILGLYRQAKQVANQTLEMNKKLEKSQQELQAALSEAENANAAKTNFLFNMSHDIRTPMNALLGYSSLMKKQLTDQKLLEYQEKIEQSGNLLLSIINNVLDMARIESGKLELDENYSNIGTVFKEIGGVFEVEAKKKGVELTYEKQVTHEHILCDETKVKEIFINLVSNAVKYTPAGGTVMIKTEEMPCEKEGYVRMKTQVIDTGIGMSEEYLPFLFESFTRERNTTIGKVAGTGLGMPIVKKLVDIMGGSIEVESALGKGSKFTVILEHRIADEIYFEKKTETVTAHVCKESIQGKRILLVEDNDLNAEIALTILEEMGLKVERVCDGIQCVAKMEQQPAGSYDLILMDIQMPNMDGYKATQTIRHFSDRKKSDIPIVAMTANAFAEDKKTALERGMNGHIAKPLDVAKMEEVMISVLF